MRRYQILDTLPEAQFDDIAELARALFEAPIALISFVDERRQWFKAHPGLPFPELPREEALCARTISGFDVLVVADARQDERFRDSPLVAGEPHVRFYAGVPLCTPDGFDLGALCVMDTRPRHDVTTRQIEMLSGLARIVVRAIETRPLADITRRVEQECRLLLQATTQYRTILEGGNEGIWVLDAEARTTYVNARMAELLGYRVEEMLGRPSFDFMDAAAREQHERSWAECKSGASSRHEFRFLRRDGADLWALVNATPIHDANGGFTGALAMCTDISDRKELDRRLEEREAAFRYLAKYNPSPMWVYDYETLMFLEVNEAATSHYGFSRDEFLAMYVTDIRLVEEFTPLLANASTERGGLRSRERQHRTKDRGLIDVETASSTIWFSGRDAVLEVIHDITDRKRAEEALRVSEARLKDAQHRAKLAYWIWDPATQSYTFGDAYREIIGAVSIDDVRTDEQFLRLVHEADRDRVAAALNGGGTILSRRTSNTACAGPTAESSGCMRYANRNSTRRGARGSCTESFRTSPFRSRLWKRCARARRGCGARDEWPSSGTGCGPPTSPAAGPAAARNTRWRPPPSLAATRRTLTWGRSTIARRSSIPTTASECGHSSSA